MSEAPWSVSFARRADKDMDRLDPPVRQRVATGIERLADDDPRADVRKVTGSEEYRLRVGEWQASARRVASASPGYGKSTNSA